MPAQEGTEDFFTSLSMEAAIQGLAGTSVALNFLLNIVLNTSLSMVWTMMNALQIIVHIPLINVSFPQNALKLSLYFMTIANFDIVPHENFNNAILSFDKLSKKTEIRFQNLGFETYNFILNSGTTLYLIIFWVFFTLVSLLLGIIGLKVIQKFKTWLSSFLFFTLIIRISLECYLELVVSCFLNL